jgi:L-fuconolactonase
VIFDAHCHAWQSWPYKPAVPDPTRGSVENLLWEMDRTGVDRAVLVCAAIGANPDNNPYASEAAAKSEGRLMAFIDVDSRWQPTHHRPGAAERLHKLVERFRPRGITHYMREDADASWLTSADGLAFLRAAQSHGLVLSLACGPHQLAAIMQSAAQVPDLPIVMHHLIRIGAGDTTVLVKARESAKLPNLHVKLSGFGYGVVEGWDFPLSSIRPVIEALHGAFGPERLLWGSDWPVSMRFMTHRQSLEILRRHCPFIGEAEMRLILGDNLERLLARARADA